MTVPAWLIAVVRSANQVLVAALLNQDWAQAAITWLTETVGLNLSTTVIENATFTIAFGLVVAVTNWLGKQPAFEWVNRVISLMLASSPAVYEKTPLAGAEGKVADEVTVDMGGEDVGTTDMGAVSVAIILVIAALFLVIMSFISESQPWLAFAVICLAVAHLVGDSRVG